MSQHPNEGDRLRSEEATALARHLNELVRDLHAGKTVLCKTCGKPLVLRLAGSGYHPGVFCDNGCTYILTECGAQPSSESW